MDWIDKLEEDAWNVVIDELVWHLREGRLPTSIHRRHTPTDGIEFQFKELPSAFLATKQQLAKDHWDEAIQIIGRFPQLQSIDLRSGA